jgi:biofilm PGA synthesis N-glycosyltransferase PgaC
MYAGTPSGGNPLSPHGKHARNESRTAEDLVELRSLPEQCHGEPDLGPSTRTRLGQIANEPQRTSPARHRRDTPGPDALRARSAPMQDGTKTVPIPRLTYEAATGSVTGDKEMAGLRALLSISTLVQDVPAAVELPRVWRSATDGPEKRHLAADEARAVDVLAAPSMRQSATVVALTRPAPAVRPPRGPAQRGPASYREPRRQVTSSGRHRSTAPVRGGFERRTAQIVVILPAHNEQDYIGATIEGIQAQTRPADRIIVVPNNCRDDDQTAVIAAKYDGVEVIELHGITGRKAGALNAALDVILPDMADDDLVVCMDADTIIHPDLLANASAHFRLEPRLGAVSSNHLIKRHGTLIELLQAMEYERDRRFIGRRKGRYGCMTGMAAMYRVAALRDIKRAYGAVYDPDNWTEDWKLTIALKHLRWGMVRPQDCLATTVPVSNVKGLFIQRERWARGYIQTLRQFGLTRWTAIPWAKQAGLLWSVVARIVLLYMLWTVRGHLLAWWCLPVLIILISDSVNTAHKAGWRAMLVALAFPVEMAYSWLITAAIASGYWKQLTQTGKNDTWKMVRR